MGICSRASNAASSAYQCNRVCGYNKARSRVYPHKVEAVYIPTKCKTKDIPKPIPSKESSVSEDVAEILKYTELLERDLEFCKGDGQ